jgi:branched-chain amino acid transport system permease protein
MSFIDPNAFTIQQSFLIVSMTIFGGMASIPGSLLGAFALTVLPEVLRFLTDYRQIIYGLLLVLMMVFQPKGILGSFNLKHIHQQDQFNATKEGEK